MNVVKFFKDRGQALTLKTLNVIVGGTSLLAVALTGRHDVVVIGDTVYLILSAIVGFLFNEKPAIESDFGEV